MAQLLTCLKGHRWDAARESLASSADSSVLCPVCKAPSENLASPRAPAGHDRAAEFPPSRALVAGYQILGELGRGGMGVVYQASQTRLHRLVALKMILAGRFAAPADLARFHAEAQAAAHLQHPNIVQVHESGDCDGQPYLVLEFVDGVSLGRKLNGKPLPVHEAAQLVETLARAMHYAHQRGVIHRDLKPANVLVAADGTLKIADFGLAKQLEGAPAADLTPTGAILGTPSYMAPEQAGGVTRQITPAADVYALGAILYELVTGKPPFQAATLWDTVAQVLTKEPAPPRRLQPGIPRDLETICLKCLAKEPPKRYASARALADDLQRFLAQEPIQARRVGASERLVKWARRRPARAGQLVGAFLLLLAAVLGAGWYWHTYLYVQVEYYNAFVKRWGQPEGIGRLTEEEVQHRFTSYKIYRRAGRVEKVEVINGQGMLTARHANVGYLDTTTGDPKSGDEDDKQECRYEYRYNDQGQVIEEAAYSRWGVKLWTFLVTSRTATEFTGQFTDRGGFVLSRTRSGAAYVAGAWTDQGYEREVRYRDSNGKPRPDARGLFGIRSQPDERGLPVRRCFLGPTGERVPHPDGWFEVRRTYDGRGNLTSVAYLDQNGEAARDKDGTARSTWEYDAYGNQTATAHFGRDGKPALIGQGHARNTCRYDEHGNLVRVAVFALDGLPCVITSGWAGWNREYDERGNITSEAYFGVDGQPCLDGSGYARVTLTYDESNNRTEFAYFGLDGKPCLHKNGYARFTATYDERGYRTGAMYFDVAGKPCPHKDGYHRSTAVYDERGNQTEEAYFGVDGKPCLHRNGFARLTMRYDERGNQTEVAYFGLDGTPCRHRDGCARFTTVYDERGNRREVACFGRDGQPCLHKDGHARFTAVFDDRGNESEEAYFGVNGEPCIGKGGFARLTRVHDERGNSVEEAYYGVDGKPCLHKDGYARFTAKFDERGHRLQVSYFGLEGKPCLCTTGFAGFTAVFDNRGNQTDEAYFGLDGKPCLHKDGYARSTTVFDERGNQTENACFGLDGKPCRCAAGFARATMSWDSHGNMTALMNFGPDGQPCPLAYGYAGLKMAYDSCGNRTESVYLGVDGQPCINKQGFARVTLAYDDRGNNTEKAFWDQDGKPVKARPAGYSRVELKYDPPGNLIEAAYFDEAGQPVVTCILLVAVPADRRFEGCGLEQGDVLQNYDGQAATNVPRLKEQLRCATDRDRLRELVLLRNGKPVRVQIAPGLLDDVDLRDRVPPR